MKRKMIKSVWVILPAILSLLASCATTPKIETPPEEFKAHRGMIGVVSPTFGTIGIVSASFQPEIRFQKPLTKGEAAFHDAGEGALLVLEAGSRGRDGFAALGGILLAPVGGIIGSVVGSAKGFSSGKIKETEDVLNRYLATLNFQEKMREHFLSVAWKQTQFPFVPLEMEGPKAPDEEVTYASLSESGIDTVLEISLRRCELFDQRKKRDINPILNLRLVVGLRLIRVIDGRLLFIENFVDKWGDSLKFSDWGANDAKSFREALDHGFQSLAELMVDRLFFRLQAPADFPPVEELHE